MARWGTGLKWGAGIKWGGERRPFAARVEVRDSSGSLKELLDSDLIELTWEYHRIGGCGAFTARLARPFDAWGKLVGGDDLQVKVVKPTGYGFDFWFRGYVTGIEPALAEPEETVVYAEGYAARLEKVVVIKTYTARDAGLIARDILDDYVVPNTEITYAAADVPTSGFTVDEITFNTTAAEALRTLADMLGREWGVTEQLKFFMLDPTDEAAHFLRPGGEIEEYRPFMDWAEVINEVVIQGGLVGGNPATFTVSRAGGSPKRQAIVNNSAVTTSKVAEKLGNAILDERQSLKRRASLSRTDLKDRMEREGHPLKRLVVENPEGRAKWGTGIKWGSGLKWQGRVKQAIETIYYRLGDAGVEASVELGSPRPSAVTSIGRIERQVQQLAARA